jgi:putative ABC transport system ATP-binding protein
MTEQTPLRTRDAAATTDLVKVYGSRMTEVRALDGMSVTFPAGGFAAIMGPSGSGKSTLLHCMAGLDRPTSGSVRIGDTELTELGENDLTRLRRDRLGFIFQAFNLIPTLTAAENIELPLRLAGVTPDRDWLDSLIGTMGLGDRLDHRPAELSGGQQQRVAAARALATRPDIVFGDEPTGNLDSHSGGELLGLLQRSARQLGQTIVMVTHDASAAAFAERVIFLADGCIVDEMADPTSDGVLDRMKHLELGVSAHVQEG